MTPKKREGHIDALQFQYKVEHRKVLEYGRLKREAEAKMFELARALRELGVKPLEVNDDD